MIDLPDFSPLKIIRSAAATGAKQVDSLDHLLVILPPGFGSAALRGLPKAAHLERLARRAQKTGDAVVTTHLENKRGTAVTLAVFSAGETFKTLSWARKLIGESTRLKAAKLGIVTRALDDADRAATVGALLRAAGAAAFRLPSFKTGDGKVDRRPGSVRLLTKSHEVSLEAATRGILGNNIARWLTALPPNKLTVASYRTAAQTIAQSYGMRCEFLDTTRLKRLGAGAFLAVAQGNAGTDAGIIHLSYRPGRSDKPALALVGKGILFDTGGTNLKPFKSMLEMHTDMQGSAVALGTAAELADSKVDFGFDVWLAVTENRISATSYKSQDIVVAANGTSIQVIHTDAEGRMVLADTLALAADKEPALIIDYATLTGACVAALTTRYSGVFSNRAGAARSLLAAGVASGERVWPFPLDDDFDEPLKSEIADIKQCAVEGAGDHIFAARFLKRFVPDETAWVHMDLSAGQNKGGLGAVPTEITGFGVAYTLQLLAGGDPAALAASWQET